MKLLRLCPAFFVFLLLTGTALLQQGCKKDQTLTSGGALRFSTDTLTFDTVFTGQGSFTLGIKIFNTQNQRVMLSSVRLAGGAASFFTLNVDGQPGKSVSNIEVAANDSFYVFATVNVDPTQANQPFVIEDQLIATLNGQDFSLPLMAYGQNAYYITDSVLAGSPTWLTDKPYVIIHSALIDAEQTLTIPAGARIYMHADSRLIVLGKLIAEGTKTDSIIFQGDRLDRAYFGYQGYPGEWGGIYFDSYSSGSRMTHVLLANCGAPTPIGGGSFLPAAIQVSPDSTGAAEPQLTMDKCVIQNSIGYGLLSFGGHVRAANCLIHSCGAQAVALIQGGADTFNNCTFAIFGNSKLSHTDNPTVVALNYYKIGDNQFIDGDLQACFRNCVIWGGLDNEFIADKRSATAFNLRLDHCLLRSMDALPDYVANASTAVLLNEDPLFIDVSENNYHPQSNSPLIDAGVNLPGVADDDLEDKPRSGTTDIGCYEY